jgi:hypothetical protein
MQVWKVVFVTCSFYEVDFCADGLLHNPPKVATSMEVSSSQASTELGHTQGELLISGLSTSITGWSCHASA